MTHPQPPGFQQPTVRYVYVHRPRADPLGVFAWIVGVIAILCVPIWSAHLGIVPIVTFLLSLGLTISARAQHPRSAHWVVAASLLAVALLLNTLAAVAISM